VAKRKRRKGQVTIHKTYTYRKAVREKRKIYVKREKSIVI
jgi:hypothetical protein